jgi:hypothetical protein
MPAELILWSVLGLVFTVGGLLGIAAVVALIKPKS